MGTCSTPAALMVSQKRPSLVLASPMVPKATSLPCWLRWAWPFSSLLARNTLLACANPSRRGIWPAVGDMSGLELYWAVRSFHSPRSSKLRVA